jgi:hypothetical protein
MAALLTKDEIIAISFTRKVDTVKIMDKLIESVQYTHIQPFLGKVLFDKVIATPLSYTDLLAYLKPIIAYYVKYYVLPEIWIDISTTGINKVNGNNRTQGQNDEFNQARQSALDMANLNIKLLTGYLNDNYSSYPDYYSASNPANQVKQVAGFIFKEVDIIDVDDYYSNT